MLQKNILNKLISYPKIIGFDTKKVPYNRNESNQTQFVCCLLNQKLFSHRKM